MPISKSIMDALRRKYTFHSGPVPRSYIMPDGTFLGLDYYNSHADVQRYLNDSGVLPEAERKPSDGGCPSLEDRGCIRCNLLDEGFIMLSEKAPTPEQWGALTALLDKYISYKGVWRYYPGELMILEPHQKSNFKRFKVNAGSTDEMLAIMKNYYRTGAVTDRASLFESEIDYGTAEAEGDDIFDVTKLGGFSNYERFLPNSQTDDLIQRTGKRGEIAYMTPDEYYAECAKAFKMSPAALKADRTRDQDYMKALRAIVTDKRRKFPLPFIDRSSFSQEGLHRMAVAGDLFGWDHKFPVLVIDWASDERRAEEQAKALQAKREADLEDALDTFEGDGPFPDADELAYAFQRFVRQRFGEGVLGDSSVDGSIASFRLNYQDGKQAEVTRPAYDFI